ncbi:hypothetical protein T4A_4151 [Trichinella pseudospiralis]|uniref:Uncharacterized protein n=1 Tax=Trichinella pseudospiralis TaxID=6337 RepID=A0A0V1E459_TRIPS|nr:hypothetical protein T4A_4151 [Trichinella pseudospiralis]
MVAMCIVLDIRLLLNGPSSWSVSTSSISCILFVCQRMNLYNNNNNKRILLNAMEVMKASCC